MSLRPRRRKQPNTKRHYREVDKLHESQVRRCCPTSVAEPHLADCVRSSKCRDKRAYSNRDDARHAAGHWTETGGLLETAYRCPSCDRWHIGHPANADEAGL